MKCLSIFLPIIFGSAVLLCTMTKAELLPKAKQAVICGLCGIGTAAFSGFCFYQALKRKNRAALLTCGTICLGASVFEGFVSYKKMLEAAKENFQPLDDSGE